MSFKLKRMALADGTDLNFTNWGFMRSIKNRWRKAKNASVKSLRKNLLTARGTRPRFLIQGHLPYAKLFGNEQGPRMIVLMRVLIHRSEKWKWVFDNVQKVEGGSQVCPAGGWTGALYYETAAWALNRNSLNECLLEPRPKKKHFYRWYLAANSRPANCQLLADPLWRRCGGFTLLFLSNTDEQGHDAGDIAVVIVQRRIYIKIPTTVVQLCWLYERQMRIL